MPAVRKLFFFKLLVLSSEQAHGACAVRYTRISAIFFVSNAERFKQAALLGAARVVRDISTRFSLTVLMAIL